MLLPTALVESLIKTQRGSEANDQLSAFKHQEDGTWSGGSDLVSKVQHFGKFVGGQESDTLPTWCPPE